MRNRIIKAIDNLPPSGIALHGTNLSNAISISKSFLNFPGYYTIIPNPKSDACDPEFKDIGIDAFFSRAISSISIAASYSLLNRNFSDKNLPAILVFAFWEDRLSDFNLYSCSNITSFHRLGANLKTVNYLSFGDDVRSISGEDVRAIISISEDEGRNYKLKSQEYEDSYPRSYNIYRSFFDSYILKTLLAIESISLNPNQQEILYL